MKWNRVGRVTRVLVAVVIVLSVTAGPAVAQDGGDVPLDGDREHLGTVTVDGETYEVYRQQNTLSYASGVEIFRDGQQVTDGETARTVTTVLAARRVLEREGVDDAADRAAKVTSREEARAVFEAVAWQQAVERVGESDLEAMKETAEQVRDVDRILSPLVEGMEGMIALFDWMKNTSKFGVSVWDLATKAAPTLETFETTVRLAHSQLGPWEEDVGGVASTLPPAIDVIEGIRGSEDVDFETARSDLQAAISELEALSERTTGLATDLEGYASTSRGIADEVSDIRVYSDKLEAEFTDFADMLDSKASDLHSFSSSLDEHAAQFEDLLSTTDETRSELLDDWDSERSALFGGWESRQDADTKVYGTVGGGSLGIATIGLAFWRRRL